MKVTQAKEDPTEVNKVLWNKWADLHVTSTFYDVEGFRKGRCSLNPIEVEEVGDVRGKTLLHLQCHFGMDTLSWARRGAKVTGVDFSPHAVASARALAEATGLEARFVESRIQDLPENLEGEFDVVFTSAGVLVWLDDIERWGEVAARYVKPGGMFYIREFHPFAGMFDDEWQGPEPRLRYPYFSSEAPMRFEGEGSYAAAGDGEKTVSYEWTHSLSDVINSLTSQGLLLEFVHEFPFTTYKSHPFLRQGEDGLWRYPDSPNSLPMMFSVKATKPT